MHAVRRTAFALVALALVAGACGDDDDDAATGTTAATVADDTTADTAATADTTIDTTADTEAGTDTTAGGDAPAGELAAYCDALLAWDAVESPGGPEGATPEAVTEWAGVVRPLLDDLIATAPDEAADALAALDEAVAAGAEGDVSIFEDPALLEATGAIEAPAYDGCGYTQLDITAGDYLYEGVPATVPSGPLAIRLTNAGAEPHIILAIQRADGNTTPAEDLVDEFFAAVTTGNPPPASVVGGMAGDPPFAFPGGGVGGKVTDLAPGSYVFFCPIETLADPTVAHYQEGMIAEVEVVG